MAVVVPRTNLKLATLSSRQTQRAVAQKSGVPETRLSEIYRGVSNPTDAEKASIAEALGVPAAGVQKLFAGVAIDPAAFIGKLTPSNFEEVSKVVAELIRDLPEHERHEVVVGLLREQLRLGYGRETPGLAR